jgi:hypothetical protein
MLEEIKKNIEDMKVKSDAYLEGYSDAVRDVEELLEKRTGRETTQLKPCECGNTFCIVRVSVHGYYVGCSKCGKETACYMTKKQAVEDWNRRNEKC